MPCCTLTSEKFNCKENDKNSDVEGPSNLFRFHNRTTYDNDLTVNVLIHNNATHFDIPQLLKTSQNIDENSLPNISLDAPSTLSTVTLRIAQQPASTSSTFANQSPLEPEENHAAEGTHVISASSARSTHPIVEADFASVQNLRSFFEIFLQLSSFYSLLTIRATNPQWGGTVHVFDGTYSAVALANAGFHVDSFGTITCSGCQEFQLLSVEAFRPSEHNSQRSLRDWRTLISALSLDTRHGVNCETRQLRHAHSAAGRVAARSTPLQVTSGRSDARAMLVRSLQEPAERSEMPREAADRTRQTSAITNSSAPLYAEHRLVQTARMLCFLPHNTEPLPNGNGRRPLTMREAQDLIRVVDFKRDFPRDERQRESESMRSAERRWDSFMHEPQIFNMTVSGRKLAFYLSQFGLFLSYWRESNRTRSTRTAPSAQFACSFCKWTSRLRISRENDPETAFRTLHTLHNLRSPTCIRALGLMADNVPFSAEQRSDHLRPIAELEEVASRARRGSLSASSASHCLTPPGLFRRVRMNEAAVLSVPNTTHFDASTERDCIRDAVNLPELLGLCDAPTALTEDCEEYNVNFASDNEPRSEQLLEPELDSLRDVNSPLYDMNDARLDRELNSETIANPAFYDPCTVLLGVTRSASAELSNAVLRAETFDRRHLRVDVEEAIAPWPRSHPSPRRMAAAGFYLAPTASRPDRVRCFYCGAELSGWSANDNPFIRHVLLSANCAYLLRMRGLQWVRWHLEAHPSHNSMPLSNRLPSILLRRTSIQLKTIVM